MTQYFAHTFRFSYLLWIIMYYGLDEFIFSPKRAPSRWLIFLSPRKRCALLQRNRGERLVLAIETLGPVFIKFGQLLSARQDVLSDDVRQAVIKLQDQVTPFPTEQIIADIEATYDQPITKLFKHFDHQPLACASIAQVHTATLHNGENVVIKVLRPHITKDIARDINLIRRLAQWMESWRPRSRHFKPVSMVDEFKQSLEYEVDLLREAANYSQLKHNFKHSPLLYVPKVYWDYAKHNMIVLEKVHGIRIDNVEALRKSGVNLRQLAEQGVEIFFTQVFRDRFFHADMHPGNLFVDVSNPEKPRYIAVDFGIMGTLSTHDQYYLAHNFLAFFNRDYLRIAQLHLESKWVPLDTRMDQFEATIRCVCEPVFGQPLANISFSTILRQLFQTAETFRMKIHPELLLLQKTLYNVEALGHNLYPELNLWTTAKPFLEKWIAQQISVTKSLKYTQQLLPSIITKLSELPDLIHHAIVQNQELQYRTILYEKQTIPTLAHRLGRLIGPSIVLFALILFLLTRVYEQFNLQAHIDIVLPLIILSLGLTVIFIHKKR